MSDLIDFGGGGEPPRAGGAGANSDEQSVSELSSRIRRSLEDAFGFVRVRGEIGRISRPRSGHVYLDLKDEQATLGAVIWRSTAQRLRVEMAEGLEVVAEGRITTFPGQSRYQMVIERLRPAGAGALMAMLEARKAKLAAEGVFDAERKQAPPFLPRVIGVATSPSGAVIRDILHRVRARFPTRVLLWPVAVQGEASAREVAAAIRGFDALPETGGPAPRPDVVIVARGGGSVEDLWSFNDEDVARAAAACRIPLISAVGHETDVTLIDFAADRRAPTPSAAAEMATPVRAELSATLGALEARRRAGLARALEARRARLRDLGRALPRPEALTALARQRLDHAAERLPRSLAAQAQARAARLARAQLSPAALARGVAAARAGAQRLSRALDPALARALDAARAQRRMARHGARLAQAAALAAARRSERVAALGRLLEGFSHKATLARGFAAVRGPRGVVSRAADVAPGAELEIEFADGRIAAVAAGRRGRGRREDGGAGGQGSLF